MNKQVTQQSLENTSWDLIVIGGGITGAGVALQAQRSGLNVLLLERQDFSWGTSSRSSKMVHGGLRYLASGDVATTRHSVQAREMLLRTAPGLVQLMPYLFPHYQGKFPGRLVFGLLLRAYDWLAGKRYRRFLKPYRAQQIAPLLTQENLKGATEFADAITDDSRLVMRVLHEYIAHGGTAVNYCGVESIENEPDGVLVHAQFNVSEKVEPFSLRSTAVVNATAAWANELRPVTDLKKTKIRPARGSHIVVEAGKIPVSHSLTLQSPTDQRPIFVYPWLGRTVVGTTDLDHGVLDNNEVGMSQQELDYLLQVANHYFPASSLQASDVITSWAGVRPLVSSGASSSSAEKRDHSIWLDQRVATVSGGKLTTFLTIATDALYHLAEFYPVEKQSAMLGPDPTVLADYSLFSRTASQYPVATDVTHDSDEIELPSKLSEQQIQRLHGFYGKALRQFKWTGSLSCQISGTPYFWSELLWCAEFEMIHHLDDLLLRRLRIGLLVEQGGMNLMPAIRQLIEPALGWDDQRWQSEIERYQTIWNTYYFLPTELREAPSQFVKNARPTAVTG